MTMPRRVSRRLVLRSLAGMLGAAAAAGGGAYHWRRLTDPTPADFVHLIKTRLGHLNLDPEGVERFAREYVARYGARAAAVHHRETLGGVLRIDALRALLPAARQQRLLSFERHLVSLYLRSTTYFTSPSGARVAFVAFADPYEIGCANPLAEF